MRGHMEAAQRNGRSHPTEGLVLSPELIEKYLDSLAQSGCTVETLKSYRRKLEQLCQYLPEDKRIFTGTLEAWRNSMMEQGYSNSTINICTTAANGLVSYCGHRELQIEKQLRRDQGIQPELTRNEYLRLLSTARSLGKEQEYLIIKVLGSTGVNLQDLPRLTVETIQDGRAVLSASLLFIPKCLRMELLDYAKRQGLSSGPIFVTKNGNTIQRTNVTKLIQSLCQDAQVDEKKANPRCLKKLYQATQAGIRANLSLLMEQTYDRLLETEQLVIGWKQEEVIRG